MCEFETYPGKWKRNKYGDHLLCHIEDRPSHSGGLIPAYEPRAGAYIYNKT